MPAGRPRIPTKLKLISGTFRPDRANPSEPTPVTGIPEQPANLSPGAKRSWKRFSTLLGELGVLTVSDGAALQSLCEAEADLASARQALRDRGGALTYETVSRSAGLVYRPYPELALIAEADHRLMTWLARFGLSPADRSKVSAVGKGDRDPNDRYFR